MAHELKFGDDGKAAMFYVGEKPWHDEGTELGNPPTAAEAIKAASLDWTLVKAPLFYHRTLTDTAVLPDTYAVVPDERWPDKKKPVLGIVSGRYEILQNKDAFAFFDPLVKNGYATYETAGALGSGERVWILAKLNRPFEIAKDDKIERYLLLSNRHDGHGTVNVKFTPIRVVCQNTLSMAMQDAREFFAIRHDEDLFRRLGNVADEMRDRIEARYIDIKTAFTKMQAVKIDEDQADGYFAEVYSDGEVTTLPAAKNEAQEARRREQLWLLERARICCRHILFESPTCRIDNAPPTVWTAYNAVTEYVDHWRTEGLNGKPPSVSLNSIWFGDGQQRKLKAFTQAGALARKLAGG